MLQKMVNKPTGGFSSCDINFKAIDPKFSGAISQPFLNGFVCSVALNSQKICGYS